MDSPVRKSGGQDFSSRTSSFKRLGGSSVSRSLKPDQLSSVLSSRPRFDSTDFKENVLGNNNAGVSSSTASTVAKPSSPATPKRSRKDLGLADDTFDDISPIASPHMLSPRTTPKRRRSQAPHGRSLLDLFSSLREDSAGLAMSVDFSKMPSVSTAMVDDADSGPSTPICSRKQSPPSPPRAPRKACRSVAQLSRSCPNLLLREDEKPAPRRLDFGQSPVPLDYGAIMSIVGFVSSFITRTGCYDVSLEDLAHMLQSASNNFKTRDAAIGVLNGLALASPQWIRTDSDGMFHFETTVKSFDVLNQLRLLKRSVQMTPY